MSQNNFILDVLGIKDPNIKLQTVATKQIGLETVRKITAKLTSPIARCHNWSFTKIVKNDYRKTYIRLASLDGTRYELILWKQRYYCKCIKFCVKLMVRNFVQIELLYELYSKLPVQFINYRCKIS
ncbi:hypothetical protein AALA17_06225 [Lactobacillaceae bacterium 24-114]